MRNCLDSGPDDLHSAYTGHRCIDSTITSGTPQRLTTGNSIEFLIDNEEAWGHITNSVAAANGAIRFVLEEVPALKYLLHEEEVPRAGVRVSQSFQRTRWRDGHAWVWLGVRKQTGRGESSSGLAFDCIVDAKPPSK